MESNKTIRIFNGATAIITGAASGIGRAFAKELAKRGCEVLLADLQIELAEKVSAEIRSSGGKAIALKLDVTNFSEVEKLVQDAFDRTGRLDFIFNNAGIVISDTIEHLSIEDWDQIVAVNLRGVINGVKAAYQLMLKQGFGHIINTASMAAFMVGAGNAAYTTTKYAVLGLSKALRVEAAQMGIRVSILCPGLISTPILEGGKYGRMSSKITPKEAKRALEKLRPMSPNLFAKKVLKLVEKNKAIIIVPSWWKVFWWINRLSPSLGMLLAQKSFQYRQKKIAVMQKR